MNSQENPKEPKPHSKHTSKLPEAPGVYFFRHKSGAILYIGKATILRDRVRSYFSPNLMQMRGEKLVKMMEEFHDIDFQQTDSVLEAMILEANLIRKYQPPYNTKDKDNKSFNYIVITDEKWPRVMLARGREIEQMGDELPYKIRESFGPFPQGSAIKEGLEIIRKIFPFRDQKCVPCEDQIAQKTKVKSSFVCRPCFNRQIGLCPGVCTGEILEKEYAKTISHIRDFFEGNKKKIIKNLMNQMKEYATKREYEKAGQAKRQIFALNHIHDISLIKKENIQEKEGLVFRVEAYDIAHMSGKDVVGVMTVVENGVAQKAEYRKFKIKDNPGINDTKALREVLQRRLNHEEWRLPNLIVVDGAVAQKNAAESVLEMLQIQIPVMAVTKDEHHKPKNILGDRQFLVHEAAILLANAEAHRYGIAYHKKLRERLPYPQSNSLRLHE